MNVGVLGSGEVGQALGAGFAKHGYQVMIGTRNPDKPEVRGWVRKTSGVRCGTFTETAQFGELIVLATLGRIADKVLELAGLANLAGKTIIDTTNPLADESPVNGVLKYTTGPNESLGERLQSKVPDAHVVKAFNSVGNPLMVNPSFAQGTPTMFFCGNNDHAKEHVAAVIRQFGWEPLDCGGIAASRAIEPLCMLWCIRGFRTGQWKHAFKLISG